MRKFVTLAFFAVFCLGAFTSQGQKKNEPVVQTPSSDSLKSLADLMYNGKSDMIRYEANEQFMRLLKRDLKEPDAFSFVYDSIRILSVVYPDDKKFKILTWSLPLKTDKFENYGLILVFSNKSQNYKVVELQDVSSEIVNPEKEMLKKGVWYGAVYYQLIEKKHNGEKFYTLIGWNGGNGLYQQKVIDIVTFDRNDEPVFGKLVFRGKGFYGAKRIIFRYSNKVAMKLRFEEATFTLVKKKERKRFNQRINTNNEEALRALKKKKRIKTKTEQMIVFDQLIPSRPELTGQFQFYYPVSETGNGFYFEDGRWVHRQVPAYDDSTNVKTINNGLLPK